MFNAGLSRFTSSKRFIKVVDDTFTKVDMDMSGEIEPAELLIAILLLNHELNKIPFLGRQEPPSKYAATHPRGLFSTTAVFAMPRAVVPRREKVDALIEQFGTCEEGHPKGLDRAQFLTVCRFLCKDVSCGISRHIFAVLVICPMLSMAFKAFLENVVCKAIPPLAKVIHLVPDSIWLPLSTTILTALTPIVFDHIDTKKAERAAVQEEIARKTSAEGAEGGDQAPKAAPEAHLGPSPLVALLEQAVALLIAILVPMLIAFTFHRRAEIGAAIESVDSRILPALTAMHAQGVAATFILQEKTAAAIAAAAAALASVTGQVDGVPPAASSTPARISQAANTRASTPKPASAAATLDKPAPAAAPAVVEPAPAAAPHVKPASSAVDTSSAAHDAAPPAVAVDAPDN